MTPKELINTWVSHFNNHDAIALSEMYHPHAINHQVNQEPIEGKPAWKDPKGLRGCGFFHFIDGKIMFQRGYWDKLSFLRMHNMPLPGK